MRILLTVSVTIIWLSSGISIAVSASSLNPIVKARMDAMKEIGANFKILGMVSRGRAEFSLPEIHSALKVIENLASSTPSLFKTYQTDDLSEAGTEIWDTYDDFRNKAVNFRNVASELLLSIKNEDELGDGLMKLGATCKACHGKYRN